MEHPNTGPGNAPASQTSEGPSHFVYVILLVLALGVVGAGAWLQLQQRSWTVLAAGAVCVIGVLAAWTLATGFGAARRAEARRLGATFAGLNDRLQQMSVLLNVVTEQQMLSDRAKSVAFREKERDALRRAIREDMARKDYEAAMVLVNDMEHMFGYKQESDRFREEINRHRMEAVNHQIRAVAGTIEAYCRQEKWTEALREAERLMQTFPGNDAVQRLPQDIETRRQAHKKQLTDSWADALARKDIDGAIEILKKLDLYLTRTEGEQMQEAARDVFKEKLNNLRVQFTLAVQDHKWTEAIRVGEFIIRDFPNSGISREVRETMDTLRRRAIEPDMVRA